jgi:hypothetical protein
MFSNRMHLVAHGRKCVHKEVKIFVTPLLLGLGGGGGGGVGNNISLSKSNAVL